jgi:DNA-directed RNA polymerase alpha subunit
MNEDVEKKIQRWLKHGDQTREEIVEYLELEVKLGLSVRTANSLRRAGIGKVKELQDFYNNNYQDYSLLSLRNLGKKSLWEIKTKCQEHGIELVSQIKVCPVCKKEITRSINHGSNDRTR